MNKERQSVKRRIFISNNCMVLVTLSLFLFVNLLVIRLFEMSSEGNMINSSELADNSDQIKNILTNWEPFDDEDSIRSVSEQLEMYGYKLCVEEDGKTIYSNTDYSVEDITDEIGQYIKSDSKVHIYVQNYMTFITKRDSNKQINVYALTGEFRDFWNQKNNFTIMLILILIDGIICIGALLLISQIFTKRLIKHIIIPLDVLSDGVKRMKEENFSEKVKYNGDIEFEEVCDAFNLMQEHIIEVNAEKEAYERARIDMVSGISHDLRTPLTAIRGTIKGLQDGVAQTPELKAKFLDTAYRRTLDMDQLLEKLFYFSKLETGNMPLFFERIEWKEYLENFCKKHDVILEKNVLNLKLEDVQQGIYSNIDREQMNRILDNLLENSKKYAEIETVNVIIRTYLKESYFVLEVSDNGYGVAKDKLNHIFEQFYRGDESRSKKEGNGLGLYIVKYLVEAMGGSVTAENRDGLTVQLSLPIIEKEDESNE